MEENGEIDRQSRSDNDDDLYLLFQSAEYAYFNTYNFKEVVIYGQFCRKINDYNGIFSDFIETLKYDELITASYCLDTLVDSIIADYNNVNKAEPFNKLLEKIIKKIENIDDDILDT